MCMLLAFNGAMEHRAFEQDSLSSSVILTLAMPGDPLTTPRDAGGISRSRKKSSGDSATSSSTIGTEKLATFTPAGKVTGFLVSL